jgi:hypothetical protein
VSLVNFECILSARHEFGEVLVIITVLGIGVPHEVHVVKTSENDIINVCSLQSS